MMTFRHCFSVLLICLAPVAAKAAPLTADDPIYKAVAAADAALFGASNRCDLDTFGSYLADDLEFYHDQVGVVTKAKLIQSTKDNICNKSVRELVPGSLRVYPVAGYGAIETGTHRFINAKDSKNIFGEAEFAHVWRLTDGKWKLARVLSFDH